MPYPLSDHYDGKQFFNPGRPGVKSFWEVLKWKWQAQKIAWPNWVDNKVTPQLPKTVQPGEVYITFVNHATHLLQFADLNVLTDPVYSLRTSPFTAVGPKRVRHPGLAFEDLPPIQVVIISHSHYDHMDAASIRALEHEHKPWFVVPLGNGAIIKKFGAQNIIELDWWEKTVLPKHRGNITLVPAQHWSSRSLFDRNRTLWGGFVIESGEKKVLFPGDTGYGPHFSEIHKRLGKMDISILPIGAYEPRWFMQEHHMNPEEAVEAHLDLGSRHSIATHYGTFCLTDEGIEDPVKDLRAALAEKGIAEEIFYAPETGETVLR